MIRLRAIFGKVYLQGRGGVRRPRHCIRLMRRPLAARFIFAPRLMLFYNVG